MDDRKVAKELQAVALELADGREIQGMVFLRLFEAHHSGRQKVGELLNSGPAFLPVKTREGVLLINPSQVVALSIAKEDEADELMTLGKPNPVRIRTSRARDIAGVFYVDLPAESSRMKDYLHQSFRFFPLFQAEEIMYINRDFIVSVQD